MKNKLKQTLKEIAMTALILTGIGGCMKACEKPAPTLYADSTLEIRNIRRMEHGAFDALYLHVYEDWTNNNARAIHFLDYGFNGKLDKVRIEQQDRKEYSITNSQELLVWQPIFEQMREKRFGNFKDEPYY